MITAEKFHKIRKEYGHYASWAVWADQGDSPKSNIADLSVLDAEKNHTLLEVLNPEVIFIGLNISRPIDSPLGNFHDPRPSATDYKIRHALKDTPYWGGYMTDIIKDFEEKASGKMISYLRSNPEFEKENVKTLQSEIEVLSPKDPVIIAFGRDAEAIVNRHLKGSLRVYKIPHYANYVSKEKYRAQVLDVLSGVL